MVVTKNVNDLDIKTRKAIRDKAVSSWMTADQVKDKLWKVWITETNPVTPVLESKQTIPVTPVTPVPPIKTPEIWGAGVMWPWVTETPPPSTTVKIEAKKETPVKTEEIKPTGLPQSIEDWKTQGSNISDLSSMIETQNNTTVINENWVLKGNIDWIDYQWNIDEAWNPIKTKIWWENVQDIFTQLQAWIELPDTWIKTTPEYKKAEKRFNDYSLYQNLTPEEFGVSLADWLIIPGTQLYKDLSTNPEIKIKLDKAHALNKINDVSTDVVLAGENLTETVLNDATISNYMSDNNISAEEFNNLTTTPESIAKWKEVEALWLKVNDLRATYDSIRAETEAEFKWTGASKIQVESLIARRQADIRPALNLAIDNYNTVFWTYTDLKQTGIDLFKTNLWLYQTAQKAQADQQALQEQRKFDFAMIQEQRAYEKANKWASTSIIQVWDKQQLINTQTWELIKEYDVATETPWSTSDWAKLDDTTLYNQRTWETKSVTPQEASNYTWLDFSTNTDLINKYQWEASFKNNNPTWMTWGISSNLKWLFDEAGVNYTKWTPRPSAEWGNYIKFATAQDWLDAYRIALTEAGSQNVKNRLATWVWTQDTESNNRYANDIMTQAWIEQWARFEDLSEQQLGSLMTAQLKRESPNFYNELARY